MDGVTEENGEEGCRIEAYDTHFWRRGEEDKPAKEELPVRSEANQENVGH
jgi:hypothetical protein